MGKGMGIRRMGNGYRAIKTDGKKKSAPLVFKDSDLPEFARFLSDWMVSCQPGEKKQAIGVKLVQQEDSDQSVAVPCEPDDPDRRNWQTLGDSPEDHGVTVVTGLVKHTPQGATFERIDDE